MARGRRTPRCLAHLLLAPVSGPLDLRPKRGRGRDFQNGALFAPFLFIPDRIIAPPELATNAPILNPIEPVSKSFSNDRDEFNGAIFDRTFGLFDLGVKELSERRGSIGTSPRSKNQRYSIGSFRSVGPFLPAFVQRLCGLRNDPCR